MTRPPTAKAMREAAAMARAFAESGTGKGLRETVRRLITDDEPDALDAGASDAATEAREASAGLITDDEPDTPAADQLQALVAELSGREQASGAQPIDASRRRIIAALAGRDQADAAEKIARPKRGGGRPPVLSKEDAEAAQAELKNYLELNPKAKTEQQKSHIGNWLKKTRKIIVSPSTVYGRVVKVVAPPKKTKTPPR